MLSFEELIKGQWMEIAYKNNKNKFREINLTIEEVRDRETLIRILEAKDKGYKRILVVYGGSHYYTQHLSLEKYFGSPTYTGFL
jgi:CRISPR/Cas system CMR subunit Cmr6 (Cas7 group RAMP superfamily)